MFQIHGQEQWKLVKDKNGIKVFTRTNTIMSFKEFKAVMEIRASVDEFLSVLYDVGSLTKWGYNLTEAKLISRPDELSQTYYAVAKAPWPYKNRDGIYSNVFDWDKKGKTLTVEIELIEGKEGSDRDLVRLDGFGYWQVNVVSEDKLEVIFQMQVDPGGSIKAWLANMFVTDSPFYTMEGLREMIKEEKYKGNTYNFLKN
ncbi:hypothetical protein [Lutimonas vermicola]|uniref:Polyketide cyclase n=1 Tax=Lutimonas vermicola TaxID=414288 RepID=A0ABU9L1J6_9FLAO